MEEKFVVSSSPHIKSSGGISSIMLDVVIALIPAACAGVYFFGLRAAALILTTVASCVLSEYIYQKIAKKPVTVGDLSAVVTGLLLSLSMPSQVPLWMAVIGGAFAIVIVKQLYGGLGKNFMNPAVAARCFMMVAWAGQFATYVLPFAGYGADAVSSATPLAILKGTSEGTLPTLLTAFLGAKAGCIGETSGLMLLIGFVYLLIKRVVDVKIPLAFIATFAVFTYLFGENFTGYSQGYYTLMHILTGGLLIGTFFMATDYVTTPTTALGQVIFGIGCGLITFAIRKYGAYPEGVSFAIIIMNVVTPIIERFTRPKSFGEVKSNG